MVFSRQKSMFFLLAIVISRTSTEIIPCNVTENIPYQCLDGTCIERGRFCDGKRDCPDGSDEYKDITAMDGIMCQYRRKNKFNESCVLPSRYHCDHELDCADGKDECGCPYTFRCDNGDCALKVSFCDNLPSWLGCCDETDEKVFNRTTKEGFQCPVTRTHLTKICVLPDRYVCDGDSDCDFGIDECFCENGLPQDDVYSNDKCFRCLDGSLVIPNIHLCDGIAHCADLSDECICPETKDKKRPAICNSVCHGSDCECPGKMQCVRKQTNAISSQEMSCIESEEICDDLFNCGNKFDEQFCPPDDQIFMCKDGSKQIKMHQFCNGPNDCDDGSDENECHELTNHFCENYRANFQNITDWNNVSKDEVFIPPGYTLDFDRPFFTNSCDGIPMCAELDDECNSDCETKYEFCDYVTRGFMCPNSKSLIIGVEICDGKPTCNDTAPERSADEFGCPDRFYCKDNGKNRLPIHIPIGNQCNGIQECDDMSDELNCSTNTHFYCEDDGSTLFVPRDQVCDGRKDCKNGRDECQDCNPSPFSSNEKLIKSRVLIVFLWIIGLVAMIGNMSVIVHQILNLIRPTGAPTAVATSNRILVLNLSTSDLLVGIYLVALGIKDAEVTEYCLQDQEWRGSTTCSALGSIALIGTETSVFILLIMTAYRLYLVVRPFKAQKMRIIGIMILLAWAISFSLAFAPFARSAQDYFISCVWFKSHYFIGRVCRKDLQAFAKDLVLFEGSDKTFSSVINNDYSWDNMFAAMQKLNTSYVPERFFGYYSAHSVCLPRLFPDPANDRAYGYSLFIILINFFAFLFILISYIHIYRTTTGRNIQKAKSEQRAAALQTKVTRIVLTDFCCWMPICIMAFIRVSGEHLSDEAYAVTAIILLPINSAMNPFLYSDILDIIWEKMIPLRKWFSKTSCGRKIKENKEKNRVSKKKMPGDGPNSSSDTRSTTAPTTGQQQTGYCLSSVEIANEGTLAKEEEAVCRTNIYCEVDDVSTDKNGNNAEAKTDADTQL